MKKIKKILLYLFTLYIFFIMPKYCMAVENKSYNIDTHIMYTAIDAMKINACAIKAGDDIICTVKDYTAAKSVIDAFYYRYAEA